MSVIHFERDLFALLGCYVPVDHTARWRLSWWRAGKRRRKQQNLVEISLVHRCARRVREENHHGKIDEVLGLNEVPFTDAWTKSELLVFLKQVVFTSSRSRRQSRR